MSCCSCCAQKAIGILGWILTIIFGLVGVAGIVLGGVQFKLTDFSWVSGIKWNALGIIAIVAICIIVAATAIGLIQFCCCKDSCCFSIIFLIVQMIVLLFALAIAIFGLVSSSVGIAAEYVGCDTKFKGLLDFWTNFDQLFIYIDLGLCSTDCPCDFSATAIAEFTGNITVKKYYDQWTQPGKAISFDNCTSLKNVIIDAFHSYDAANGNHSGVIDIEKFGKYWNFIEDKFNCTGWCKDTYDFTGTMNGQSITSYHGAFFKYLYSDINRGIVENVGCLKSIMDWLPPIIRAYGIVGVIAAVICLVTWLLGMMLLCNCYKSDATK